MPYHQIRILHEAEDDLVEYRSKVRFELDRDPLSYEPNDTSTNQLVPAEENRRKQILQAAVCISGTGLELWRINLLVWH